VSGASPIASLDERASRGQTHQRAVRAMFDRIAPTYDLSNRLMSLGMDARWRSRAVAALGAVAEGPVLDLCAGTMDLTAIVARVFPRARVVACDFASKMLEAGREKAPRAETVVADALALPFADGTFGAVLCGFGVRNLADTARGVREVRRVLAPGGRFVTLDFFQPATRRARAFHALYAKHALPAIGGLVSGDRGAYDYLARSMEAFLTRDAYEALLCNVGFGDVRGVDLTLGVASIVTAGVPR
jgi:ubiquinone/menaquinone biosynthesis methyltransferase